MQEPKLPAEATATLLHHLHQQQALDRVMALAEFDLDGVLRKANDNYLSMLGYTRAQALGQHHRRFCPPQVEDNPCYAAFWADLRRSVPYTGLVEHRRSDASTCWLESTYVPVTDAQGQLRHVLQLATDVSARVQSERAQTERLWRLSLVADASDAAVLISDARSHVVYVNAGFTRMLGWTGEEVVGKRPIALLAPQHDAAEVEAFHAILQSGRPAEREDIILAKDGQRYWAKVVSNPIAAADGGIQYIVSVLTDITRAKMHEALQHRVLDAMARDLPLTAVLELVCLEVQRIAPDIVASILGVDEQRLLRPLASPSLPRDYSQAFDGLAIGADVGSCGTAAWRNEAVFVDDIAADPLWAAYRHLVLPLGYVGCWSTPIRNSQGQAIGTFAFYFRQRRSTAAQAFHQRLIDACTHLCTLALEREHARQRIRQLAFYDSLTGLPNRALLHAKADQAIAAAARGQEQLAVLFIDLDRFKQVNDSLGHPAGDALLRRVADRLQSQLRSSDISGRLSGDEFVVVLSRCDAAQVTDMVERLQVLLAEPVSAADAALSVSASVGIAMFPADGHDMDTLLHRADMAMYQAKSSGRGHFRFFSPEMNQLAQERLALETALRQAITGGQLRLHYQPQVDMATGQLHGVEALARWTHPELGEITPARFIPLAEDCGLVADLGHWAVREACRQLAAWRAQGLAVPAVSVNLSPTSFHNLDLPRSIAATLDDHALRPQDLTLELTESVLLDTHPSTMKTISEVHAQGVRLSMDDFGTGYSSLSYLRRLPVHELKLDRSFVADLPSDATARALSAAILGIGTSLQLTVVAEGVENQAQELLLREQGYPVAQGYLFAKPMPPDALAEWLDQMRAGGGRADRLPGADDTRSSS